MTDDFEGKFGYRAVSETQREWTTIVLHDPDHDAYAAIIPEVGNNLYQLHIAGHEIISSPAGLHVFREYIFQCFKFGTPILFPPNRIKNGRFTFLRGTYTLPLNKPPDYHLHGELCTRPWEIIDMGSSDEQGSYFACRFQ